MPYDRSIIEWLEDPVSEGEAATSIEMSKATVRRFMAMSNPQIAAEIATASYLNPTASPELIVGSTVVAGMPAEDDLIAQATDLQQRQTQSVGGISGFFSDAGDLLRGVTRSLALGFNGLYDEIINRPLRTMANMVQGQDLGEAYANSGNAPFAGAGEAISQLLQGNEVNIGTGWLPSSQLAVPVSEAIGQLNEDAKIVGSGDVAATREIYARYAAQYGYIAPDFLSPAQQQMMLQSQIQEKILEQASDPTTEMGKAQSRFGAPIVQRQQAEADSVIWNPVGRGYSQVSMGRVFAGLVTEPGTQPFHYLSGATDFMANIALDPTNIIGLGIAKATKARQVLKIGGLTDEVVEGVGTATRQIDDVTQEIRALDETPEMRRYNSWTSPDSRLKADRLANQGLVDPAHTVSHKYQQAGRAHLRMNQLQAELTELSSNPDLMRLEGWADSTRGRVDALGELDTEAWLDLHKTRPLLAQRYDVARRAKRIQDAIDATGKQIVDLSNSDEYRKFGTWSERTQQRALKLGREADLDPATASKKDVEWQRIGRVVADVTGQIDAKTADLAKLNETANYTYQVRKAAGILEGPRKDIDPKQVSEFISGPTARKYVDSLVDADLAGVDKILSNVKGVVPRGLRTELAEATTRAEVIGALMPHLGGAITHTNRGLLRVAATPMGKMHQLVNDRVTSKLLASGGRYGHKPLFSGSKLHRWFIEMSPGSMDLSDLDRSYIALEHHAANLGWQRGDEILEGHMKAFADLEDGDFVGAFGVLENYNKDLMERLIGRQLDPEIADAVTRFTTNQKDQALWFLDRTGKEMGDIARKTRMRIDGSEVDAPGPQLISELFKGIVHMPDPRLVRHAASELDGFGRIMNKIATQGASKAFNQRSLVRWTNYAMTKAWKPSVLLRIAWPLKIIAEEQARMMMAGISRPYTHPIHHISMALADHKMADVLGDSFTHADEFARANSRRVTFQGDFRPKGVEKWVKVHREGSYKAWREGLLREYNQLWSDPIVHHLFSKTTSETAEHLDRIESTTKWLFEGEGKVYVEMLSKNADEATATALKSRDTIKQYVESVYARAHMKAGGDFRLVQPDGSWVDSHNVPGRIDDPNMAPKRPTYEITAPGIDELVESYGTGKLRGFDVAERMAESKAALKANPNLTDANKIRTIVDEIAQSKAGKQLPPTVKGVDGADLEMIGAYEKTIEYLFDFLMSRPTNYLSRSPAFRDFYWKNLGEMTHYMDEATADAARAGAEAAGTLREFVEGAGGRKTLRTTKATETAGGGQLITDLKYADQGAKAAALTQVQDLLFDVSKRKNSSDALSIIMPFADAWGEVLGTWAKLTAQQNVRPFRRLQQIVESGRESDMFNSQSGYSNEGFFRNDGDREVFTMPGLSQLYNALAPGEHAWETPLTGLSLATSVLPAFGPAVQMVAQPIIPNDPAWSWLKNYISPNGATSIQRGLLPSSWQRIIASFEWSRNAFADDSLIATYNGAVQDAMALMEREDPNFTEKYRADPEGTINDAKQQASQLFWVQALARFVGPAAPSTVPTIEDKNGFIWKSTALSDEFYKMLETYKGDRIAAVENFISRFGISPFGLSTAKSVEIQPRGKGEIQGNFAKANPDLFAQFPSIAFFLGPAHLDEVTEFDWNTYYAQLVEGSRVRLTPEQWMAMLNDSKGRLAYAERKRQIEDEYELEWTGPGWDTDLKKQLAIELHEYDIALMNEYQGYAGAAFGSEVAGIPARASVETMVNEWTTLFEMRPEYGQLNDEGQPNNPGAYAASKYLELRAIANANAQSQGHPSVLGGGEGDPSHPNYRQRQVLRQYAADLIRQYPEFGPIWESVFAYEMVDDTENEMTIEDAYEMTGLNQ